MSASELWPRAQAQDIPAPPFLLLLLQEGEALGGRSRKEKWLDTQLQASLSAGPLQQPQPPVEDWGRVAPSQLRIPGQHSQGVRGTASAAWAHLTLTHISRNWWNGKTLWEVTFPPSAGSLSGSELRGEDTS